jgi:endonuclease/exonuclease/phosphatase family metal-dependent hydrolase
MASNIRVFSLNAWGGRCGQELLSFLEMACANEQIDVLCFQEVFNSIGLSEETVEMDSDGYTVNLTLFSELCDLLVDFRGFFVPFAERYLNDSDRSRNSSQYGTAVFVHARLEILSHGHVFIHGKNVRTEDGAPPLPRVLQHLELSLGGTKSFIVANVHGLWQPNQKRPSAERRKQATAILRCIERKEWAEKSMVLVGDFNLRENDPLFSTLIQIGFSHLIEVHSIGSTRSKLYEGDLRCGNYALCRNVKHSHLHVLTPEPEVSDHLPLILEAVL